MATFPPLEDGQIEAIAKVLGECGTGSDIDRAFAARGLVDLSQQSTKWRRLYWVFSDSQTRFHCANHVLEFIRQYLSPSRFVGAGEAFERHRRETNAILAFSGLEYGNDGHFRSVAAATTIADAERRVRILNDMFQGRRLHPEVMKYCRKELLQDNYFHAVFEASKGMAQRIRQMTGLSADGRHLVEQAFGGTPPRIAMSALSTQTERSEHEGLTALLKGCFAAIRNPLAHEPRTLRDVADDAADYLSLMSMLHRQLDKCGPDGGRSDR